MVTQPMHWVMLEEVDSTNSWLMEQVKAGAISGATAVFARIQTAGRGRRGRVWQTGADNGIAVSLVLPLTGEVLRFASILVGLSLAQWLESMDILVRLKWPNDLLVDGKKLGGILCETTYASGLQWIVVGVGINFSRIVLSSQEEGAQAFSLEAVSLEEVSQKPIQLSREQFAHQMMQVVCARLQASTNIHIAELRRLFAEFDAWYGQPVRVLDDGVELLHGVAAGLSDQGEYLISTDSGLKSVCVGDLSLRRFYG